MGTWCDDLSDEVVEAKAREICTRGSDCDPDQMTYITDDGIQQPYGPAWAWHVGDAIEDLRKTVNT